MAPPSSTRSDSGSAWRGSGISFGWFSPMTQCLVYFPEVRLPRHCTHLPGQFTRVRLAAEVGALLAWQGLAFHRVGMDDGWSFFTVRSTRVPFPIWRLTNHA